LVSRMPDRVTRNERATSAFDVLRAPLLDIQACRKRLSSRPEEFHLRALLEPCMTLSSHTAPDVQPLP
jgi:hypothetical protein